jgi:hypothetical protein
MQLELKFKGSEMGWEVQATKSKKQADGSYKYFYVCIAGFKIQYLL